jgi:hypothetical protein
MTHYDETKPQIWKVPLRDELLPGASAIAPSGGYIVPAAYAQDAAEKLKLHGVEFKTLAASLTQTAVEAFRADRVRFGAQPIEGHQMLSLEGAWKPEKRDVAAGSIFVPIAQPKARLVIALLEPQAPDSLAAWGMFNGCFERKEYMESYVAEDVAREQLAADPKLAAQFKQRLADDAAFAGSPALRLEFFARRHPSWDERFNLYPIMRVATVPN